MYDYVHIPYTYEPFGREFTDRNEDVVKDFLYEATKNGYSGGVPPFRMDDGASSHEYEDGNWYYIDLWYGGQPYSGITTICHKGKVCWTMTYWGEIFSQYEKDPVHACLISALKHVNPEHPFRGPSSFIATNGLRYHNYWHGNAGKFYGCEVIDDSTETNTLYRMDYRGGFVNIR